MKYDITIRFKVVSCWIPYSEKESYIEGGWTINEYSKEINGIFYINVSKLFEWEKGASSIEDTTEQPNQSL